MPDTREELAQGSLQGAMGAAERILGEAFGGLVRLSAAGPLSSSRRSMVARCRVLDAPSGAPASVIIKQATDEETREFDSGAADHGSPAWRLVNEWAGTQFLGRVMLAPQSPGLYGGDRRLGLVVLEDVGGGASVQDLLRGDDPAFAEAGLIALAAALGRMHAATIGRSEEFVRFRQALGPYDPENWSYGVNDTLPESFRRFQKACGTIGLDLSCTLSADLEAIALIVREPGSFLAYTHGDPCPVNARLVDGRVCLLDYEFGMFRHALLDGVCWRVPFPTDLEVNQLPDPIQARMEEVYRAELVKGCPEAADDTRFRRAIVSACGYWLLWTTGIDLPYAIEHSDVDSFPEVRQRILARLDAFAALVDEFGYLHSLGKVARGLAMRLRALWPSDIEALPVYPAFCVVEEGEGR